MRRLAKLGVVAVLALVTSAASAQHVAPDVLLETVTAELIALTKVRRGHLNVHRTIEVNQLMESKVLPLFDFGRMTQRAVGPSWPRATPEQREALTAEFKTLLVDTYTTALRHFRDHEIDFKPLDMEQAASHATVCSVVKRRGAMRLTIDYDMARTAVGWKVYEIRIDGVNLIENYRSTFAAKVRDAGFEGLIRVLAEKNRQNS